MPRGRKRVTEFPLQVHILPVQSWPEPGCDLKVPPGTHDAKGTGQPAHAMPVRPMGCLSPLVNNRKHRRSGQLVNGQPLIPIRAGLTLGLKAAPGNRLGSRGAFRRTKAHAVDDALAETGVSLQEPENFPFDRPAFEVAGTPAPGRVGELPALGDSFEQRLAGRHRRQDQGDPAGDGCLDMLERTWPFHLTEGSVDKQ